MAVYSLLVDGELYFVCIGYSEYVFEKLKKLLTTYHSLVSHLLVADQEGFLMFPLLKTHFCLSI